MWLTVLLVGGAGESLAGGIYWGTAGQNPNGQLKSAALDGAGGIRTIRNLNVYEHNGQPRALAIDEAAGTFFHGTEDGREDGRAYVGSLDGTTFYTNLGDFGDWPSQAHSTGTHYYVSGCWNDLNRVNVADGGGREHLERFFYGGDRTTALALDMAADIVYGANYNDYNVAAWILSTGDPITPNNNIRERDGPGLDLDMRPTVVHLNAARDTLYLLQHENGRFASMSTQDVRNGVDWHRPGSTWDHVGDGNWRFFDIAFDDDGVEKLFFVDSDWNVRKVALSLVAGSDIESLTEASTLVINTGDMRCFDVTDGTDGATPARFRRGDADGSGSLLLNDAVLVLAFLFQGAESLPCEDAADANDTGRLDLSDAVYVLNFLFLGGAAPPLPFDDCAEDPTIDDLACQTFDACD